MPKIILKGCILMLNKKSYVYRFIDKDKKIIYVGKSNNLDRRYGQHFKKGGHLPKECYNSVWKMEYIKVDSELNALLLETYYINKYRPKYNKLNKTYRATSTKNVNLKEIKSDWKTYRVVHPSLSPKDTEPKKLTLKQNIIFYSIAVVSIAIVAVIYFK